MKKLVYLFLTVLIVACSGDDSGNNSNLAFFEKYDGVVWEEQTSDYLNRLQINNGTIISVKEYFVAEGYVNCNSYTLLSSDLIEVTEDSFSFEGGDFPGDFITTVTATNNGNDLIIDYSDDPEYPNYLSRTNLTDPCE